MNILLLCDRKSACGDVQISAAMQSILASPGHNVETVVLKREELAPCIGCYCCWLKTPGKCAVTNDAANDIASKEVNADAVVLLSQITYGGFSADIKAFLDRSIQNILPFFEIYKGEMHHPKRYERFPAWIAVGYGNVSDAEKQTFNKLAERNALNLRPAGHFSFCVNDSEQLSREAGSILKALEVSA